jgi:DNA-directed RNA polymerase subunit RPC12/RpoP
MKDDILGAMGPQGPQIDPTRYPQITCDKCGHNTFRREVIMYNVPGVVMGAGSGDFPWPLPVYVCAKCGTIIKAVREEIEEAAKKVAENKEATKGTSLIL